MRADVHVVSFPKCGRTWLVLLIGKAIAEHHRLRIDNPLKLRQMAWPWRRIPYILQHHDGGPEFLLPEEIPTDKSAYAGKKVIFLVRDPRDVLVSLYFQLTRRNANFDGTFDEFLAQRRGGLEALIAFYNAWAANRQTPRDFLLVTYEDLHQDPHGELRRVLAFLGVPDVSDATVDTAVEYAHFDNMREIESSNALGTSRLAARDADDPDSYKTRRGEVGGYTDYLDGDALAWVNATIREQLDPFYARYR